MAIIRNKLTGETKEINETDLPRYGIRDVTPSPVTSGLKMGISGYEPEVASTIPQPSATPFGQTLLGKSLATAGGPLMSAVIRPKETFELVKTALNVVSPGAVRGIETGVQRLRERPRPQTLGEAVSPSAFWSDVLQPMVGPAAATVGTYGVLPKVLPAIFQPFKKLGEVRAGRIAEISGKPIKGENFWKVGKEYIKNDELAVPYHKKIGEALKNKNFGIEELVNKMQVWGRAYNDAKEVRNTALAGYYNALYKEAVKQLQQFAPKVAEANKLFSMLYTGTEKTGKFINRIYPWLLVGAMARQGLGTLQRGM